MDKKLKVMNVAIELFATRGFDKTSINLICEEAGVSKGLIFHHFKNKDDLLRQVFLRMAEIMNEVDDYKIEHEESLDIKDRFIHLIDYIFYSMADTQHKLYYQFDFQVLTQPLMREKLIDLIKERYQLMMESFEVILNDIPNINSEVISHMLIAEIDGIAMNYLFSNGDYPLNDIHIEFKKKYRSYLSL